MLDGDVLAYPDAHSADDEATPRPGDDLDDDVHANPDAHSAGDEAMNYPGDLPTDDEAMSLSRSV